MAWSSGGTLGTAQSKAASTTVVITTSQVAAVGSVVVVQTAWDNVDTTDIQPSRLSVTDSVGNVYRRVGESVFGTGTADNGAHVGMFISVLTIQLPSAGTITVTCDTSKTAKAASAWKFSIGASSGVEFASCAARTSSFGTENINDVATDGNGMWVAVGGTNSKIATATDPTGTWTQRTSPFTTGSSAVPSAVAYGNGIWVAVNNQGDIATATDPTGTWTLVTSPPWGTSGANDVAYGNGAWVAVNSGGQIITATDPTGTWTLVTTHPFLGTDLIVAVHFDNGVWLAGGTGGKIATATDPTATWTSRTSTMTGLVRTAWFGNGLWVIAGDSGQMATAPDPTTTWTSRTSISGWGTSSIEEVAYANGVWVAVGGSSPRLTVSTDPTSAWTQRMSSTGSDNLKAVAYGSGLWVVVAASGGKLVTTDDPLSLAPFVNDSGVDASAQSFAGLSSRERLYIRAIAGERNLATITQTTNFTVLTGLSTTGGSGVTNMGVCGEFRINTSVGETSDPTTAAADQASIFAALVEVPPPQPRMTPYPQLLPH